jgi:hypothetical protein
VQEGGRSPSELVAEEQLPADQSPQILTGLVQISDELLGSLSSQDVVFIFAKASDGPPHADSCDEGACESITFFFRT